MQLKYWWWQLIQGGILAELVPLTDMSFGAYDLVLVTGRLVSLHGRSHSRFRIPHKAGHVALCVSRSGRALSTGDRAIQSMA